MNLQALSQDYLTQVLGWKETPRSSQKATWIKVSDASAISLNESFSQKKFALYVPRLGEVSGDQELLDKMMGAIGIRDFELVSDRESFKNFNHILNFSNESLLEQSKKGRFWNFGAIGDYLLGEDKSISSKKRSAWKTLQEFKMEAF
ncbi:hypothetical protein GW916_09805 [bacterium]|nr:hypothetical protein [bacterium]